MRHLSNERLAELARAGAEEGEGEKEHLADCARCAAAARFFAELRGAAATNEGVTGDERARAHAAAIVALASAEATALGRAVRAERTRRRRSRRPPAAPTSGTPAVAG